MTAATGRRSEIGRIVADMAEGSFLFAREAEIREGFRD
jgi:hypothetical protein